MLIKLKIHLILNVDGIMGYIDTILGYGANHMKVPLRMIFSKIVTDSDMLISLDEEAVYEALKHGSLAGHLQDDLFLEDAPDKRVIAIDCEDDFHQAVNDSYISKVYGCRFGRGCCFHGVIVGDCHEYGPTREIVALEEQMLKAQKWVGELKEQGRIPSDVKLVLERNCCS